MNKNLKKVISSVAALTMVASSVAAFAVDFPDVESTASYAQAVQELSALDVISGYDDGTFGPDKLVTRAEITKMIVDALAERSSAEASTESTKFADVSADHWAKGYINQGVANGFIAGMSDTEFDPDANVTYVQAQKMLVSAIGYETFAQAQGGWPTGYKTYAASLDITKGISGIKDSTELTRAQVAQMIDNAMDAPLCVIAGWKPEWNGTQTPNLEIRDGKEGRAYETLFTEKHDAYKVYGRVTETSKSENSGLDADQVKFKVEKADKFDDDKITTDNMQEEPMYIGNSGADKYLLTYAQALIQKNDDDEYTILSIAPAAANKTVTLASEDYDSTKSADAASALYFYPAGTTKGSVKYALDKEGFEVYVNGVKDDNYSSNIGNLKTYLASTDTASVTLQKKTKDGSTSTSSDYNIVMISTYSTAIVESVTDKSNQTIIYFDDQSTGVSTKLTVDKDDEKKSYSFILDGAEIEPTELQEDDVLNIAYDKTEGFSDSSFYDVYVTRNVVEGVKCTSIKKDSDNENNTEYTMGGTKYKAAEGMSIKAEISTEYTLNLDHFGRIARIDETASSKNYGILKNIYKKAGGDYMAQIITKTGAEEEYKIDSKNVASYQAILGSNIGNDGVSYADEDALKKAYVAHVIDYSVSSSSNKITIKNAEALTYDKVADDKEYKADNNKIGNIKLSDSTVILSIEDTFAKDTVSVVSSLTDGTNYTAYAFGKSSADSTYRFVIITKGLTGFDSTTQLAIYNGSETVEEDGENVTAFNVIIDGEEKQFIVDDDSPEFNGADEDSFEEGDPIVFVTNAEGKIQKLYSLFAQGSLNKKNGNFSSFLTDVLDNKVATQSTLTTVAGKLTDSNDTVDLYFGPVVNKSGSNITIGAVEEISGYDADGNQKTFAHAVNYDGEKTHEISYKDAKIYTYDFAASSRNSRVLLDEGIASTPDSRAAKLRDKDGDIVDIIDLDSSEIKDDVVYALVRSIDDNAQEIYLIVNNND